MSKKLLMLVLILAGLSILHSCGSGGSGPGSPGSNNLGNIGASVDATEVDHVGIAVPGTNDWSLDLHQDICTGGTAEKWGDDLASVLITATSYDLTHPSGTLYINHVTVDFQAQNLELNLQPVPSQDLTTLVTIPHDTTGTVGPFMIMKFGDKENYWQNILSGKYNPAVQPPYLYDMKVTLYGVDSYGTTFSVVVHRTVQLADYSRC